MCNGCLAYGHEMAFNRHLYWGTVSWVVVVLGGAAAPRLPLVIED